MQEIYKFDVKISVIPNGLEKYMAFTINNNLVFIDNIQSMNSGLDALVKNLSDNDIKYLSQEFSGDLLELAKQKGVYPYEYIDSFEKFSEDRLPDRYEFYNSLKDGCINEKDYLHAVNVWNKFKMNTMGDYHDHYLKTCLKYYGLDSCHYFSSPGLNWDAMLKMTEIELKLISNSNMHYIIVEGIRGGISCIAKRYSKANNKYMTDYDSSEESKFLIY